MQELKKLPPHLQIIVDRLKEKEKEFTIEEISCDEIFEKFNTEW